MAATTTDDRALVGVAACDDAGRTVVESLVQPPDRITDLRSDITGYTPEDFSGVTTTLEEVRRQLLQGMASAGGAELPVLVGHALHHDLAAMKLDYWVRRARPPHAPPVGLTMNELHANSDWPSDMALWKTHFLSSLL